MLSHDRLAGLDSMVLDINQLTSSGSPSVSTSALDGISYVMIPRIRRKGKGRIGRSPLGDKTYEFNLNSQKHTPLSRSSPIAKGSFLIHRDHPVQSSLCSPSRPSAASTSSFHPLPPVLSTSELQLPSFPDFSIHPVSPVAEPFPQTLPVRGSRSRRPSLGLSPPKIVSGTEIYDEKYNIPAFQHPNSPYVPWTSPTRRRILQPLRTGSVASSSYSHTYSRSGAMAPEPDCSAEKLHGTGGWQNIRRAFKQNVVQVKKRMSVLARPFRLDKLVAVNPVRPVRRVSDESIHEASSHSLRSRCPYSPSLRSPRSITSMMSTESNSLAQWLAERQHESMQRGNDRGSLSLDDYEKMGSWINEGVNWSCGVPKCEVHPTNAAIGSTGMTLSREHEEDHLLATVLLASPSHSTSQFCSAPMLPSMRWLESKERVSQARLGTLTFP